MSPDDGLFIATNSGIVHTHTSRSPNYRDEQSSGDEECGQTPMVCQPGDRSTARYRSNGEVLIGSNDTNSVLGTGNIFAWALGLGRGFNLSTSKRHTQYQDASKPRIKRPDISDRICA